MRLSCINYAKVLPDIHSNDIGSTFGNKTSNMDKFYLPDSYFGDS